MNDGGRGAYLEPNLGGAKGWALPILRALETLGGQAAPMAVEDAVRTLLREQINDLQWARVLKHNHIRWARHTLKKAGLIGGERGEWDITSAGRDYLQVHRDEPTTVTWNIKELSADEVGDMRAPLETVEASDFAAYEIPILRALSKGAKDKTEIYEQLEKSLRSELLPGDHRVMPRGRNVWRYRASWALTDLKKSGYVRNPTVGRWEITEAGNERLKADEKTWRISDFRGSQARVRGSTAAVPAHPQSAPPAPWPTVHWSDFATEFEDIALAAERRLRPDLGPSPEAVRALPRNLILYGPPGTGKTWIAKKLASALTGDDEPGQDSRWRVVQFHPSYAYEDFVQGLRPDLENKGLRYSLRKGPFLQACDAAEGDPDRFHVLIIDEINRGDPARIFGELLYGLEYRSQAIELPLGGELNVPPNLIIVGTMNSVDRSVALVDYALRRRFAFVRIDPDPSVLPIRMGALLDRFNSWLVQQLDVEHAIGQSVFLNPALEGLPAAEAIDRVWGQDVRPLLEEYFFGQPERLKAAGDQWTKANSEAEEEDEEHVGSPGA
jgi:5-methylcytosine-specific restriction protein B